MMTVFILLLVYNTLKKIPATNRYIRNPNNKPILKIVDVTETVGVIATLSYLIFIYYNLN